MKFILAPDSFKGSLDAAAICVAMAAGIRRVVPEAEIIAVPMADGGEGTVAAITAATGGRLNEVPVHDPLGRMISASFGMTGDGETAVIEMAAASGLPLLKENERNPLTTSTRGTGDLIKAALDFGAKEIILGIGGSATNDGGMGMARALGVRFFDSSGRELPEGGGALVDLDRIDLSGLDSRLLQRKILVACDVTNPLTGPQGAAAVYSPQKGADPAAVDLLDRGLQQLARVVRDQLYKEIETLPGAGAAGGLGGGLVAFLDAELTSGIELVIRVNCLAEKLQGAALLFTGEGRLDGQSVSGKTISGVARLAAAAGVPVIVIAGSLGEGYESVYRIGVTGVTALMDGSVTLEDAINNAASLIADATTASLVKFLANEEKSTGR